MKRILSAVLAAVMVLSALSACSSGNKKAVSLPSYVDEDGFFAYSVVRGAKATLTVEDSAKNIRAALKDNFDCKISIVKDSAYEDFDGNYEILVGDTNRDESAQAKKILTDNRANNGGDFIVVVFDDKICIQATTDNMVANAAAWFVETFCDDLDSWNLLTEGYQYIYAPVNEHADSQVAGYSLGLFTVVKPYSFTYLIGSEVEAFVEFFQELNFPMVYNRDSDEEAEYEVLIGDTTRAASKAVTVEGDNYIIQVSGKKLVLKGGSDLATREAVSELLRQVKKAEETKTPLNWSDGYVINGKYDPNANGAYTLNWSDEFEGNTLDVSKWGDNGTQATGEPGESCLGGRTYNVDFLDRSKYTTDTGRALPKQNMIYVSDGAAHLGAIYDGDVNFISSTISTYWTMIYKYGFMEIRGKLPTAPANAAYWVNGASTFGIENFSKRFGKQKRPAMTEVDILENFSQLNSYAANVHRWFAAFDRNGNDTGLAHNSMDGNALYAGKSTNNKKMTYQDYKPNKDDLSTDYHIYSFYWDETCMKFAFDGKMFCDYEYTDNYSVSVHCLMNYLIVSIGMGSASYGSTYNKEKDEPYHEHSVDYVRVYQTADKNSQMITGWPQEQEEGTSVTRYPDNSLGLKY